MPLPKSATKKEQSAARLQRYHTRKAAENHFGKGAIKGKHVHHKNRNKKDNRKRNMKLEGPSPHGSKHGRGHRGSRKRDFWLELKRKLEEINKKLWCKT